MKKYIITISDFYENDIKDYSNIYIDEDGMVWYLFSYDNGKLSEWEAVGVIKEG